MRVAGKLSLISGLTAAIVLIVGASSFYSVNTLIAANELVMHCKNVLQELDLLLFEVADAVSTQRSFVLTSDQAYLDAYKQQVAAAEQSLETIGKLEQGDPEQSARIAKLKALIKERFASLDLTINVFKEKGLEAAIQRIKRSSVLQFRIRVRESIEEIKQSELSLLNSRTSNMRQSADASQLTVLIGALLALVFTVVYNYLFGHSILSRIKQLVRVGENLKYGRFDLSASTDSNDEFADLGFAFNTLGKQLQVTTNQLSNERKTSEALALDVAKAQGESENLLTRFESLAAITKQEEWRSAKESGDYPKLMQALVDLVRFTEQLSEFSRRRDEIMQRLELSRERAEHLMITSSARAQTSARRLQGGVENIPALRAGILNLADASVGLDLSSDAERSRAVKEDLRNIINSIRRDSDRLVADYQDAVESLDISRITFETLTHELSKQAELSQDLRALDYQRALSQLTHTLSNCQDLSSKVEGSLSKSAAILKTLEDNMQIAPALPSI
jgi:methyl-accepting chemotaxis protein